MIIANRIKEQIAASPAGKVLTLQDFDVEPKYQPAVVKILNRMVETDELRKLSKGKFYKPRKTIFGSLQPPVLEIVKDFLEKKGRITGYITGTSAFAEMGLTTQISSSIIIGSNKYRRPLIRNGYRISFLRQPNPITKGNIPLLRILDVLRLLREIPQATPDELVSRIGVTIKSLPEVRQKELCGLAEAYTPFVRALLGAILENSGLRAFGIADTLNGVTSYRLPVRHPKGVWGLKASSLKRIIGSAVPYH